MKNLNLLFYIFKWLSLIFLAFLIARENPSKILMFSLIGFVAIILVWEGFRDLKS